MFGLGCTDDVLSFLCEGSMLCMMLSGVICVVWSMLCGVFGKISVLCYINVGFKECEECKLNLWKVCERFVSVWCVYYVYKVSIICVMSVTRVL